MSMCAAEPPPLFLLLLLPWFNGNATTGLCCGRGAVDDEGDGARWSRPLPLVVMPPGNKRTPEGTGHSAHSAYHQWFVDEISHSAAAHTDPQKKTGKRRRRRRRRRRRKRTQRERPEGTGAGASFSFSCSLSFYLVLSICTHTLVLALSFSLSLFLSFSLSFSLFSLFLCFSLSLILCRDTGRE